MNEGVRARQEEGKEFHQPTSSISLPCGWPSLEGLVFKQSQPTRWGQTCSAERCRIRHKPPRIPIPESSWECDEENLLASTVCVWASECVWPLTSDSGWPLLWQAPVTGVPTWAEHSTTMWESAWTTKCVYSTNVILRVRDDVWASQRAHYEQ